MQVPRCLHEAEEVAGKRVITFVDASLQGYGTVVYLVCTAVSRKVLQRGKSLQDNVKSYG